MAANAGWPEAIVNQLSVIVKAGDLEISYPPSITKQINDLEYGTETEPPKMAIRRFQAVLPDLLQPYFEKELEVKMGELVNSL